ncbi:hypothetical protein F6X40_33975 [Paraburkholderia sp. UCT31]|uniref:hypothetical protein n=1 Tax=Paraburkholderia sp. UCT31 TaxID=2615209 RepID=UPI0016561767|nr:hypothetical protein [Paraburkholderia sp. UCT31]MBC8741574.1 hypothetical protein [Paraburkholderia sp. UCT31]
MGALSIWHSLVFVLVVVIAEIIPLWLILKKAGYAGAWSLLTFIPVANVILLWFIALARWPALNARQS